MKLSQEWKKVFLYSVLILVISVLPVKEIKILEKSGADKLIHFCLYLILALIVIHSLIKSFHPYIYSFLYCLCWGTFVEAVQYLVPYRTFEVRDLFFNSLGSIVGLSFSYKFRRQR